MTGSWIILQIWEPWVQRMRKSSTKNNFLPVNMTKIFLFPSPHGSQEEDYIFDEDMQGKKEILNPNSQNTNSAFQNSGVYGIGPPLETYTNFLWTILVRRFKSFRSKYFWKNGPICGCRVYHFCYMKGVKKKCQNSTQRLYTNSCKTKISDLVNPQKVRKIQKLGKIVQH